MSLANDRLVDLALIEAEKCGMFLVPGDKHMQQLLERRLAHASGKTGVDEQASTVCPRHGMYARSAYWHKLSKTQRYIHLLRTIQSLNPQWVFCAQSAAVAHRLPVAHAFLTEVHITARRARRSNADRVIRHVVHGADVVVVNNVRATSLLRTGFDCARVFDFGHGLAICDALLRRLGWSPKQLVSAFQSIPGRHRQRQQALYAASHANALSESAGESMARAAMIELGFAVPELQVEVTRPLEPSRTYRIDFCWTLQDGSRVFGEFDGNVKYEDPRLLKGRSAARVLADEQHRESQLTLLGAPMLRLCYRDIMDPARLASILSSYGIPRTPGNGA